MFSLTCQTYMRKLIVAETISFFLVYYKFFFVICIRVYMLLGNFYKCKPINKNIAFTSKSYIKAIGVTTIYIFPLRIEKWFHAILQINQICFEYTFWKYWVCNGKFKPQHIYVLAIISSSFITLHDEIANSQCRVHNKCTDGSFCFIRNVKSTPILFNLLASTLSWKNFSFFNYSFLFCTKQKR